MKQEIDSKIEKLSQELFNETHHKLCVGNDRVFAFVMAVQWVAAILIALFVSPRTWLADMAQTHVHVWTAAILGGLLSSLPIYLTIKRPGAVMNRYVNVIAQALYSALYIHLTGGRIETHFHVFASLAGFAFYRDIKVLLCGTAVVALDHAARGIFFPQSAFGVFATSEWRWMEHAAWVLFEDFFLGYACVRGIKEMKLIAHKTAEVMVHNEKIEIEVQNRTMELKESRNSIKLLLDHAGEGFFSFDSRGKIGSEHSVAVEKFFGVDPSGMHVGALLKQDNNSWVDNLDIIFQAKLSFKELKALLPASVTCHQKDIKLDYRPVYGEKKKLDQIMVIATDVTELKQLERRSEDERIMNRAIIKVLGSKNDFLEIVEMLEDLPEHAHDQVVSRRQLHTIKGGFSFLSCVPLEQLCHKLENDLKESYSPKALVDGVDLIRREVNDFLQKHENVLNLKKQSQRSIMVEIQSIEDLIWEAHLHSVPQKILNSLEELIERPVEECLGWLSDAFVATGRRLGKSVNPITWEQSAKISPKLYKNLFKSFIHVARNSADHGIEPAEVRAEKGKSPQGNLYVKLEEDQGHYVITFRDDGQGINYDSISKKAKKLGLPVPQNEKDAISLLLSGEFSTKDEITATSGRGIGLSAIRGEVEKLGGEMRASSVPNGGLKITIKFKKLDHLPAKRAEAEAS